MKINISTSYYNLHFIFGAPANKSIITIILCALNVESLLIGTTGQETTGGQHLEIWFQYDTKKKQVQNHCYQYFCY